MDINAYFELLATEHNKIYHTEDAPAFFKEFSTSRIIFDNSDFLAKMRYVKDTALIAQWNEDGGWDGPNHDKRYRYYTGAVILLQRVRDGDITGARSECNSIFEDIISRIEYDSEQGTIPQNVQFYLNETTAHAIGMIADKYYGIMYMMRYRDFASCTPYNPDTWILPS